MSVNQLQKNKRPKQVTHADRYIFIVTFDRLLTPADMSDSWAISWTDFHCPLTLAIR